MITLEFLLILRSVIEMKCKKVKQNQSGQAITEFVLGLMIMISFFFFFIKMAAVFVIGNYIHYATFMTARTYMASASKTETQKDNAELVLRKMIAGRWKNIIKPDTSTSSGSVPGGFVGKGQIYDDSPGDYWNEGATYSFIAHMTMHPWNAQGEVLELKLTSESWMPREQSEEECIATRQKIQSRIKALVPNSKILEWQNGC
jgi:hypothetical protein